MAHQRQDDIAAATVPANDGDLGSGLTTEPSIPPQAAESDGTDERGVAVAADGVHSSFITMPALSSTMTEGKVVQWLVKDGEKVMITPVWMEICVLMSFWGSVNFVRNIEQAEFLHRLRGGI